MPIRIFGGYDPDFGAAPHYGTETVITPRSIALLGADMPRLRPDIAVTKGDRVVAGDLLIADRHRPELRYLAPVAGTVSAVQRGPRRSFERLVLDTDPSGETRQFAVPKTLEREPLVRLLIEAGLWTSLRARPFDHVPQPADQPDALFVTAIDTRPLAPDPAKIIAPRAAWFERGLAALRLLTEGKTYLCQRRGAGISAPGGIETAEFAGGHPAGLVGTHIHFLHPVGAKGVVWHIGYQQVLAIGHLLETGTLWSERIVGIAGDGVRAPVLAATLPGADLHDLVNDRLAEGPVRIFSGSPIDGHVGRYLAERHSQISVLRHAPPDERRLPVRRALDFLRHGSGAVVPNGWHERAAPPGILPIPFLRAISVGDTETARRLGALELGEDDMALLTHANGGGTDFGQLLRQVLNDLEAGR